MVTPHDFGPSPKGDLTARMDPTAVPPHMKDVRITCGICWDNASLRNRTPEEHEFSAVGLWALEEHFKAVHNIHNPADMQVLKIKVKE